MKKLVVYFSASGTTKKVAEKIASEIGADIFEIEPKEAYTQADLDWTNQSSRSTIEMKDRSSRPAIKSNVNNIADYDTIILGFPVWWYTAPTIVNTFIEANDLKGKKINVFVTSGGSGADGSVNDLKQAYAELNFVAGKRLSADAKGAELVSWIK